MGGKRIPPFLEAQASDPSQALVHVLPIPMEATVSYGGGTCRGPEAILRASTQLELYDREVGCEAALLYGVYTHPALELPNEPSTALIEIERRCGELYEPDEVLVVLGGEHTLTQAVVSAVTKVEPVTVVQIDAHADLRDQYENTPYSHACVARRLLENERVEQILQLGVRSLCPEEAQVIQSEPRVRTWFPEDLRGAEWRTQLADLVRGKRIYLTLDVDGLDPSLIPATGTPEPDGLTFHQTEEILRILAKEASLAALDCVELAPIPGLHSPDFVTAKLVYRTLNVFLAETIERMKGNL